MGTEEWDVRRLDVPVTQAGEEVYHRFYRRKTIRGQNRAGQNHPGACGEGFHGVITALRSPRLRHGGTPDPPLIHGPAIGEPDGHGLEIHRVMTTRTVKRGQCMVNH